MILDRVKITIKAGNGGGGVVSFLRNAQTMVGGPDGGDGGRGGSVFFKGKNDMNSLYSFEYKKKFMALDGGDGGKALCAGRDGKDIIIDVPLGTVIYDAESNKIIADIVNEGQLYKALGGGQGGKGNAFYKSSVRQSPRFSKAGEIVNEHQVVLELKTIADIGIVGFPNVGKSTLLSVITSARPKIADYHFTTLFPNLGVISLGEQNYVIADIPGLIEGASEGSGLGHHFLKHVERVRLIVHLVDISSIEGRDPIEDYEKINIELNKYDKRLASLKQVVVLTKADLLEEGDLNTRVENFKKKTKLEEIFLISSVTHKGLDSFVKKLFELVSKIAAPKPFTIEKETIDIRDYDSLKIEKVAEDEFVVSGGKIENLIRGIVLSDPASFAYFQERIKKDGIIEMLKENGLKIGDTVNIKDISFVYEE